jgi:hypothetical protein
MVALFLGIVRLGAVFTITFDLELHALAAGARRKTGKKHRRDHEARFASLKVSSRADLPALSILVVSAKYKFSQPHSRHVKPLFRKIQLTIS